MRQRADSPSCFLEEKVGDMTFPATWDEDLDPHPESHATRNPYKSAEWHYSSTFISDQDNEILCGGLFPNNNKNLPVERWIEKMRRESGVGSECRSNSVSYYK